jgi:hypothetical protein
MRNIIVILTLSLTVYFSYGQSNGLFNNWNNETLKLLNKNRLTHESISSDSLSKLFSILINARKSEIMDRIDTTRVDVINIIEIIDYSEIKILRKEQYIDWAHTDSTFLFDSEKYKLKRAGYGNLNSDWIYKKVINDLKPRCFSFWTGSCIGGLKSDLRKAKRFEKNINKDTTYIDQHLKIETQINLKKGEIKIAFFIPIRGERCVIPVAGIWGPGLVDELILYGYFE